jgi:hypothetical protein
LVVKGASVDSSRFVLRPVFAACFCGLFLRPWVCGLGGGLPEVFLGKDFHLLEESHAGLLLLQHCDDLLFRKACSPNCPWSGGLSRLL